MPSTAWLMKHVKAAFSHTVSGALSLVILRGTRPTEPRAHNALILPVPVKGWLQSVTDRPLPSLAGLDMIDINPRIDSGRMPGFPVTRRHKLPLVLVTEELLQTWLYHTTYFSFVDGNSKAPSRGEPVSQTSRHSPNVSVLERMLVRKTSRTAY